MALPAPLLPVLACLAAGSAAAATIDWEAEAAEKTTMRADGPYTPRSPEAAAKLSGGAWLSGNADGTAHAAQWQVTVPAAGTYQLFARRFWNHGAFRWRFDAGAWQAVEVHLPLLDSVELQQYVPVNWVKLGQVTLAAGSHAFTVELLPGSAMEFNKAYGFDCFKLTDAEFLGQRLAVAPAAETGPCDTIAGLQVPQEDTAGFGAGLAHTLRLLAGSSAAQPATVRILCYGQSIIAAGHVDRWLRQELARRYPTARVVIENRAIGGYEAPTLLRTAPADVVPFRPDLVLLHVYSGTSDGTFAELLTLIRTHTNAELLSWTHHCDDLPVEREPEVRAQRELVRQAGGEMVEVRALWQRTLALNQREANALLADRIHLNPVGGALLAGLVARHFREPAADAQPGPRGVQRIALAAAVGKAASAGGGTKAADGLVVLAKAGDRLRLPFTGNRIDLEGGPAATGGSLRVLVDGKAPSATPACLSATRVSTCPGAWFPTVNRITLGPGALPETWTLNVAGAAKGAGFTWTLQGSQSGADGEGRDGQDFTSRSGRIAFLARDLTVAKSRQVAGKELPDTFTASWKVESMGSDTIAAAAIADGRPATAWLAWEGGSHVLELEAVGDGPVALRTAVVYDPAARR